MERAAEQILQDVLALPPEDRRYLADQIYDSLSGDSGDLHPAWKHEIARRLEDIDAGTADLKPWSETISRLRARLAG
jgi:putative addiction module component (TIGR02574 family)